MANFEEFTQETSPADGDQVVGYRTAVTGGERRTTLAALWAYFRAKLTTTPATIAEGGTNSASASAARSALGVAVGTDVQAYSAKLAAGAALSGDIVGTTDTQTLTNKDLTDPSNTLRAASTSLAGEIEIATDAETLDPTDTTRAIVPSSYAAASTKLTDPDLCTFVATLAATDSRLAAGQLPYIANIIAYLKEHSLWADAALIPFQRGTAAVSEGGALPALGGWFTSATAGSKVGTTTLTGSGLMLNGTDEGLSIVLPSLQDQDILTIMHRMAPTLASSPNASPNETYWCFGDSGTSRVIALGKSTGAISGETIVLTFKDNSVDGRVGTNDITWPAQDSLTITTELGPAGTRMWQGTTAATLDLTNNMTVTTATGPSETGYTTDNLLRLGHLRSSASNTAFFEGTLAVTLAIKRQISGPDREALVGFINAVNDPAASFIWWGDSLTEANHTAGWADAGNTRRLTPPTRHMEGLINALQVNRGASGETAAEIAARYDTRWSHKPTIIWAGTNDKDDTDAEDVVDSIATIVDALTTDRYIVITPLIKTSWTTLQKNNITAIRAEIISRYPNNYLDAWAVANTTSGTPDTGYLRWQSVNTEDDLHPNDDWYAGLITALNAFIVGKGWTS